MTSGADHAFHVDLHQHLNDRLGNGAQEIAISGFGQQLGQAVGSPRSSGPLGVRVKRRNSTLASRSDGHLVLHRRRQRISTTSPEYVMPS
jgi:hypothetical protein